jgi:hypothetical protein
MRNSSGEFPDNWEDLKKQVDDKNYQLDYEELTYAFSDFVDNDIIKINDIIKTYRYVKSTSTKDSIESIAYYVTIVYDIEVQILNKSKVEEYIDYRMGNGYSLFNEYYGYRLLNGSSIDYFTKYYPDRDIDKFNLWGKSVWINK